jgi:hypothetical protein
MIKLQAPEGQRAHDVLVCNIKGDSVPTYIHPRKRFFRRHRHRYM